MLLWEHLFVYAGDGEDGKYLPGSQEGQEDVRPVLQVLHGPSTGTGTNHFLRYKQILPGPQEGQDERTDHQIV